MKRKLLLAALFVVSALGFNAKAQTEPVADGVYYLYNKESGKFLSRGSNWGTRGVVNDFGLPWKVAVADGKYKLRMYDIVKGGGTSGLGDNSFTDNGSPIDFTLDGTPEAYKIKFGENFLTVDSNNGINVSGTDGNASVTWQFLNVDDYNEVIKAKKAAQESSIATAAAIDLTGTNLTAVLTSGDFKITDVTSSISATPTNGGEWKHSQVPDRGGNVNYGSYGTEIYQGGGSYTYTKQGLAEGIYKVGIKALFRSTTNATCHAIGTEGYSLSSAYLSANGNTVQIKDWYSSCKSNSNPNSTGEFVSIADNGGYYSEVYTYVGSDGVLNLSVVSESYWGYSWLLFNGVTLTSYSNTMSEAEATEIITKANSLSGPMQNTVQESLASALAKFESSKTIANYNALDIAITNAKASMEKYASANETLEAMMRLMESTNVYTTEAFNTYKQKYDDAKAKYDAKTLTNEDIDVLENPEKVLDWRVANSYDDFLLSAWGTNNFDTDLYINTWSTEGEGDGSNFKVPFFEYWTGDANSLAATTKTATVTGLVPNGKYTVNVWVRVRIKNGASNPTGITLSVGEGAPISVTTGAQIGTSQFYMAEFAASGAADAEGNLKINFNVAEDNNISWLSYKNVKYTNSVVPESIELSTTSESLTTGSVVTLTVTVGPENASDKTVTWTSSDPTIATVVGGVVTALNPGTVTITATANGDENLKAEATINVANAAAPAYYSEIADGNFYIVNAATGMYLGGANDWGTQASLIPHGIPFTAKNTGEGVYTLDSHTSNGGVDHYLGSNGYVDAGATNLYITSVGDGKYTISVASDNGYLTASAGSTILNISGTSSDSPLAQWYFVSKKDREKTLVNASEENPVDATFYIEEANLSRNLKGSNDVSGWTGTVNYGGDNANLNAQFYHAVGNVYQTITVPNGTYVVKCQGFYTDSSNPTYLYANDEQVALNVRDDSGITSQGNASAAFTNGRYKNSLTVTVTDHNLTIGVKSDATDNWTVWDNFELEMIEYIPVTSINATIEGADDGKVVISETATITATTVPANASFNAVTFSSSDETKATVDQNGVVTAVAEGDVIITVAAEMEKITEAFGLTIVKPAVIPATVTMSAETVELTSAANTATLTATVGPDGAPQAITWTSSDATVATVDANGVVTGISTGTATIKATAYGYDDVYGETAVTVTFPETAMPTSTYVNDGPKRSITTVTGENLIKNGSFEYPNGFYGWTNAANGVLGSDKFELVTEDGNVYLKAKTHEGGSGAGSIGTAWPIEAGKTYIFGYKVKTTGNAGNSEFHKVSLTNTPGSETKQISDNSTPVTNEWTEVNYVFTNTDEYAFAQFRARWLNSASCFDDFYLAEVTTTEEGNVDYAKAAIPTANIGEGVFQYSQTAIDAANDLVQGTATVEDVQNAYDALQVLNAPDANTRYAFNFNCEGHSANGNAITLIEGGRPDQGNCGLKYLAPQNVNYAQSFVLTKSDAGVNYYNISTTLSTGTTMYLTTATLGYGANNYHSGLRWTDDATKALNVEIRSASEGQYYLWNTMQNAAIAHNGNSNNDAFTNNSATFSIVEAPEAEVTLNSDGGYYTLMLPFAAELPTGMKAYTCAEVDGNVLTLTEATSFAPNTPYIVVEGAGNYTFSGYGLATAASYTEGLLTGAYAQTDVPAGSYVLAVKPGETDAKFYVVGDAGAKLPAYRAYLTVANSEVKAFTIGRGDATGISAIEALQNGDAEIYTINGTRVNTLQKGVNIIKMSNGKTQKVLVK